MKVCKACFSHVRDLKQLQGHLKQGSALMAANALVGSGLVTLCSEVLLLWIYTNFSVFRTVLPELWPTPPSIHTSLLLENHYIGS